MLDRARVVELYLPAVGSAREGGAVGTGYLLAGSLVLTAAHVVGAVGKDGKARPLGEPDWLAARVVWRGRSCDAALLELDTPSPATGPIRFGRAMAGTRAPCQGVGFPAAQSRRGTSGVIRDTEGIDGRLRPMSGLKAGLLTIDLDASVPTTDGSGRSPWAGMSGAALFSGPLLVGVVCVDPAHYGTNRLVAVPMSLIAAEPEFRALLAAHTGRDVPLEAVEEVLTDTLRPRVRAVLEGRPVFGGRDGELRRLDEFLEQHDKGYLFVVAESGLGKTALLAHWLDGLLRRTDGPSVAYTFINRGRDGLAEEDFTLRNLCQQLGWLRGDFGALPASTTEVRARYAKLLVERPFGQQVVVVLDGLDEATGWTPGPDLFPRHLPAGTRVVFSARVYAGRDADGWVRELGLADADVERVPLETLGFAQVELLLKGAGSVPGWALEPSALGVMLAVSGGDPFYLRFLVEDLQDGAITSVTDLRRRPTGLADFFAQWWQQVSDSGLAKPVRDLLGYLLVSLGPMTAAELAQISDEDELDEFTLDRALKDVRRFVVGGAKQGYALTHPRFQRYLADPGGPLHGAASSYRKRVLRWATDWREHGDHYALTHVIAHLAEATRDSTGAGRARLVEQLAALVTDGEFHRAHVNVVEDLPRLQRDIELALEVVAGAQTTALEPVLRAALGLERFRRDWLRPEAVFALAQSGQVLDAERRLALFGAEERWHHVARLLVVWFGADTGFNRPEHTALLARVAVQLGAWDPLPMLLQRVQWALGERSQAPPERRLPYPPFALPGRPPTEPAAQQIVARMGGTTDPEAQISGLRGLTEGHMAVGDAAPAYVAESDAPALVAFAAWHPRPGDDLLQRYIRIHAANPYAEYRNRSLWAILGAVACHPHDWQVRMHMTTLAEAALAPAPVAFREGLRVTLEALRARAGDVYASQRLENLVVEASSAAGDLRAARVEADAWGNHCRRLAVLAETMAMGLDRHDRAATLLAQARGLPHGFAGYRTSASMTLAEAHLICSGGEVAAGLLDIEDARRAAHNIQEPSFCALRTARVNAMLSRWWRAPIADLAATIERFAADPLAAEFASMHVVGEHYGERSAGRDVIPLPDAMRAAATLDEIAENVYQLPLSVMRRLQPDVDPSVALPCDTQIAVPERGFAAILAARLSAEALASPTLTPPERFDCIARLVPVAADNPTAMHTVLTRLLLAARPDDAGVLAAVHQLAPAEWMHEPSAMDAREFGPS